jgi:hypothetical protein
MRHHECVVCHKIGHAPEMVKVYCQFDLIWVHHGCIQGTVWDRRWGRAKEEKEKKDGGG